MTEILNTTITIEIEPEVRTIEVKPEVRTVEIQPIAIIESQAELPDIVTAGKYGEENKTLNVEIDQKGIVRNITTSEINFPVNSVNNKLGIIELTTTDIVEGTNLYYSDSRVRANKLNQLAIPDSNINLNSQRIINVAAPVGNQDVANKQYVDTQDSVLDTKINQLTTTDIVEGGNLYYSDSRVRANKLNQLTVPDSNINLNSQRIINVAAPDGNQDVANKEYVDTQDLVLEAKINQLTTTDIVEGTNLYYSDSRVRANKLNQLTLPDSDLNLNSQRVVNVAAPIGNQDVANKEYVDSQDLVLEAKINQLTTTDIVEGTNLYYSDSRVRANKLNQLTVPDNSINLNNQRIINIAAPVGNQDAANKEYVDSQDSVLETKINQLTTTNIVEGTNLYYTDQRVRTNKLNQLAIPDSDLNLNSQRIVNVAAPVGSQDVANKQYVDSQDSVLETKINQLTTTSIVEGTNLYYTDQRVRANKLNQLSAPDGNLNVNNQRITNLAEPINNQDATTKQYVNNQDQILDTKINQLTTTNIVEGANLYYTDQRVRVNKLNQLAIPNSNLNINNQRLTNLAEPVNNQDAATKQYVSNQDQILDTKINQLNIPSIGLIIALG